MKAGNWNLLEINKVPSLFDLSLIKQNKLSCYFIKLTLSLVKLKIVRYVLKQIS